MVDGGFDNYETSYFNTDRGYTCSYCGNSTLIIDDAFDDYGNLLGTRYYCTCEQAKLEQEMKYKISVLMKSGMLDLIDEIRVEYAPKLKQDDGLIGSLKFRSQMREFFANQIYSNHLWLQNKTNDELMKMVKETLLNLRWEYEGRHFDDTFDKPKIKIKLYNYWDKLKYWEVYVYEDHDYLYEHLNREGFESKIEALEYIDRELKDKYDVTIIED